MNRSSLEAKHLKGLNAVIIALYWHLAVLLVLVEVMGATHNKSNAMLSRNGYRHGAWDSAASVL